MSAAAVRIVGIRKGASSPPPTGTCPSGARRGSSAPTLEEIERPYVEILTRKYAGHGGRIAGILGVSERNIYRLLDRHGLK